MKPSSQLVAILLTLATLLQAAVSFVPSQTLSGVRTPSSELSFFGGNKKVAAAAADIPSKKQKKTKATQSPKNTKAKTTKATTKNTKPSNSSGGGWKKFARIAVTGSPDGISLLGKPQHDWVTGKALTKPKSHSWTTSYKETDGRKKK